MLRGTLYNAINSKKSLKAKFITQIGRSNAHIACIGNEVCEQRSAKECNLYAVVMKQSAVCIAKAQSVHVVTGLC